MFPGRLKLLQHWDGASVSGQCVPARSFQVTCSRTPREQQPTWAAQVSAVPPRDICHQKLPLWWPVERRGLLITHQDSFLQVGRSRWSRTEKQATKQKLTEKQLNYFQEVGDYSFLERKKKNQNSRLLNKAYFITQAFPSKQREAQDVGGLLWRAAS